jgi:hypothetical protein
MTHGGAGGDTVEVVVRLSTVAGSRREIQEEVNRVARECDVALEPLSPSVTDRELAVYTVARVPAGKAEGIVDRLRRCRGIDAAYIKPAGEPP